MTAPCALIKYMCAFIQAHLHTRLYSMVRSRCWAWRIPKQLEHSRTAGPAWTLEQLEHLNSWNTREQLEQLSWSACQGKEHPQRAARDRDMYIVCVLYTASHIIPSCVESTYLNTRHWLPLITFTMLWQSERFPLTEHVRLLTTWWLPTWMEGILLWPCVWADSCTKGQQGSHERCSLYDKEHQTPVPCSYQESLPAQSGGNQLQHRDKMRA